jgi:hypothetical protein
MGVHARLHLIGQLCCFIRLPINKHRCRTRQSSNLDALLFPNSIQWDNDNGDPALTKQWGSLEDNALSKRSLRGKEQVCLFKHQVPYSVYLGCVMGNQWSQTSGLRHFQPRPWSGSEIQGKPPRPVWAPYGFLADQSRAFGDMRIYLFSFICDRIADYYEYYYTVSLRAYSECSRMI